MERPLGAQISHMLKARGVDVIFGIPGVHNQEMYRGIEEAGITHVLARHEQGAGFMADGYARATGKPGVAYVITGPGLTNIMTPLGQGYSDSVSMLVISSCLNRADLGYGRGRLHEMRDQETAAGTVTDWSKTAMDAASAYGLIDRALVEFQTKRPLPKHIQVPIEVLEASAPAPKPQATRLAQPAQPEAVGIADAVTALSTAKRPLFILGGGAVGACEDIRRVLAGLRAASFATYAGRGIAAPDDPLHFGAYLARPDSAAVAAQADCVVVLGSRLSEVDLWRDHLGHDCPLIRVDIDPEVFADAQGNTLAVLSDVRAFVSALSNALSLGQHRTEWTSDEIAAARRRWRSETAAERPGIVPICDALRDMLPDNTMIYSDMTQFAYVAKEVWTMSRPGHWHHPYGFGTLGYGLPAAIGGKIGRPDVPVVAIVGDAGLQYTMQELGTAAELELPLVILLWDNGKLKEIEDSMVGAQIAPNAVVARNPDFLALAKAYGAASVEPAVLSDLRPLLDAALLRKGPTLIRLTPRMSLDA
jgi:acetolactate synthase-1/2/3 large subunit/5-guanidino-2-oxopentanoate decarboxylase